MAGLAAGGFQDRRLNGSFLTGRAPRAFCDRGRRELLTRILLLFYCGVRACCSRLVPPSSLRAVEQLREQTYKADKLKGTLGVVLNEFVRAGIA